ncbi:hypothetical protein D9611_008878 [Ephemerocybe angulata]|uniref:F-box domain-containing protein n=1 Tax=Ephemerocybe angulata TaxID=980116 RepID=A0A8H5C0P9_9AGAR|nr:hypothetical protein D9611_008878 [Tulosesus angulatus]
MPGSMHSFESSGSPLLSLDSGLQNPIEFLLGSNSSPSQLQLDFVGNRLSALTRQVDHLRERIKVLDLQSQICRAILSPLRRVPLEILGEIFKLVVPLHLVAKDRRMVGNLGRVCQRWRDALLCTPSIWRGLVMGPCTCAGLESMEVDRRHDEDYAKILTWYERAGGNPKSLVYSTADPLCDCANDGYCQAVHPIVTRLMKEGLALDHITLQVASTSCYRNWVGVVGSFLRGAGEPTSPGVLRSFSLEFADDVHHRWDDELAPGDSVFKLLPIVPVLGIRLPSCSDISNGVVEPATWLVRVPAPILGQLTMLGLRWDWGGVGLTALLSQCFALEALTIDLSYSEPYDDGITTPPMVLPNLNCFRLRMGGFHILDRFLTPLLTSLDLELNVDRMETLGASERVHRFLTSSNLLGSLEYLRICDLVGAPGTIVLVLPPLSALKHLVLDSASACGYHFGPPPSTRRGRFNHENFPSLQHLELLNLKCSRHTLLSEALYLRRQYRSQRCLITVSYAKEVRSSEADLESRIRAVDRAPALSVRIIPAVVHEDEDGEYQ